MAATPTSSDRNVCNRERHLTAEKCYPIIFHNPNVWCKHNFKKLIRKTATEKGAIVEFRFGKHGKQTTPNVNGGIAENI